MPRSRKIINDPIYGFISIEDDLIFELIEHRYFQRLRRIRQLGLTGLVYPGATHTRFHHALGAMHLMHRAIGVLRSKDVEISLAEEQAVKIAILLHDVGHGPFSHVMEKWIVSGIKHEEISLCFMEQLNIEFDGALSLAIDIFKNNHPKKFLHQLVSSQLDMDRLDYLTRDSFYTGVSEGIVGLDRIIQMINVSDDQLVIDEKGIYSVEKFLMARRLMYWQVYLHKTALAADALLVSLVKRAKERIRQGDDVFLLPNLKYFFENEIDRNRFLTEPGILEKFNELDDIELLASIKYWQHASDKVLSHLSKNLINRRLPKVVIQKNPFDETYLNSILIDISTKLKWTKEEASFLISNGAAVNEAYHLGSEDIQIRKKSGELIDLASASDNYNFQNPNGVVRKYFLCTPKYF